MMKRKVLAFVLALAMVVTLIPMSAFADSTNSINGRKTVSDDSPFETILTLRANEYFNATTASIRLTIANGEWLDGGDAKATTTAALATAEDTSKVNFLVSAKDKDGANINVTALDTNSVTARTVELEFGTDQNLVLNDVIQIALALKSGSTEGDVKLTVDNLDSQFSYGEYTVAIVGSGETTATVLDTPERTYRTGENGFTAAAIEIRENTNNAVDYTGQQSFTLSLPSGFEWDSRMEEHSTFTTYYKGSMLGTINDATIVANSDSRDLKVEFTADVKNNARQTLTILPVIKVMRDAKMGDVAVRIRNGNHDINSASDLVIAIYAEEAVEVTTVKEADLPQIIAGRYKDDGEPYEVEVTIKETIDNSLQGGRILNFEFPSYVQVASDEALKYKLNSRSEVEYSDKWEVKDGKGEKGEDWSNFEFTVPDEVEKNGTLDKIVFKIPVTVKGNTPSGDLKLKMTGAKAGLADTELVVGKILSPITVTAKIADIRTGIQKQALGEIIIKENFPGALMEEDTSDKNDGHVRLFMKDLYGNFKDAKADVISGDIELDASATDVDGSEIYFKVDTQSSKTASEIKVSGVTFSVDRTPAEGMYQIEVQGNAVHNNVGHGKKGTTSEFGNGYVKLDYVNVITLADTNLYGEATFAIGQNTYDVYINGVVTTRALDAPPYIDPAGRTMVSVKYAANALGVADNNIIWDQNSKTATIFKDGRVIVFKSGSNQYTMNGANVAMDVTCSNVGGRLFIPIAHLANALGTDYVWDATARTVKLMNKTAGL